MGKVTLLISYPKSGLTWTRLLINSLTHRGAATDINDIPLDRALFRRAWLDDLILIDGIDLPEDEQRRLICPVTNAIAHMTERPSAPHFDAWTGRRAVRLQVGGVDYPGLLPAVFGCLIKTVYSAGIILLWGVCRG